MMTHKRTVPALVAVLALALGGTQALAQSTDVLDSYMPKTSPAWTSGARTLEEMQGVTQCSQTTKDAVYDILQKLGSAYSQCAMDLADMKDAQQNYGTFAAGLAELEKAAGQVADLTDATSAFVGDTVEAAEKGEEVTGAMQDHSESKGDKVKAEKWEARKKKCGKWKKGAKKLLKRINLAHSTATWTKDICECAKDYCKEWEEDLEDDLDDLTKACGKLKEEQQNWTKVAKLVSTQCE